MGCSSGLTARLSNVIINLQTWRDRRNRARLHDRQTGLAGNLVHLPSASCIGSSAESVSTDQNTISTEDSMAEQTQQQQRRILVQTAANLQRAVKGASAPVATQVRRAQKDASDKRKRAQTNEK